MHCQTLWERLAVLAGLLCYLLYLIISSLLFNRCSCVLACTVVGCVSACALRPAHTPYACAVPNSQTSQGCLIGCMRWGSWGSLLRVFLTSRGLNSHTHTGVRPTCRGSQRLAAKDTPCTFATQESTTGLYQCWHCPPVHVLLYWGDARVFCLSLTQSFPSATLGAYCCVLFLMGWV